MESKAMTIREHKNSYNGCLITPLHISFLISLETETCSTFQWKTHVLYGVTKEVEDPKVEDGHSLMVQPVRVIDHNMESLCIASVVDVR
jgi:hypothetical protein